MHISPAEEAVPPRKVGRGHPPVEHQFRKGGKPGPGRPKGSKNHDTKLKERFETKRVVRIGGVEQIASLHDILIDLQFKAALEGKEKPQQSLLDEAKRLYPASDDTGQAQGAIKPLSPSDQARLDKMFADLDLAPMIAAALPQSDPASAAAEDPSHTHENDDLDGMEQQA
jgi:hypothetical protein